MAPTRSESTGVSVFLAGSVEQDAAVEWRTKAAEALAQQPVTVFNPRRKSWDKSWKEDISNPLFKEQVTWELDHMDAADVIAVYFAPGTRSPVSMLEFGLYAKSGKLVVGCPDGFWRRGNIQVVCERLGIPLFDSLDDLAEGLIKAVKRSLDRGSSSSGS